MRATTIDAMDYFSKYKSPLGFFIGDNNIDSYGVNHSGFSTRDEVEYQLARQQRENQLIQNYNTQGINKNYPQFRTNFWGTPENNYGFGTSQISSNIETIENTPLPANPAIGQNSTPIYNAGPNALTQNQSYTPPNHMGEIAMDGIKDFGQGVVTGLESLANGATFGGYNWADKKFGLGAEERRQDLQQSADAVGAGTAFGWANQATELAGGGLSGYGAAAHGIPAADKAYNAYNIYKGTRNLENQLRRGSNFEDIYMGRINQNKLNEINNIRQNLGEPVILSRRVKIPEDNVNHIWERRVNIGHSDPKDVAGWIKNSVFSDDSQVFPGNVSRNQTMIKTGNKYPEMSVVSKDDAFNGVAVRSTMKKNLQNILNTFPNLKY